MIVNVNVEHVTRYSLVGVSVADGDGWEFDGILDNNTYVHVDWVDEIITNTIVHLVDERTQCQGEQYKPQKSVNNKYTY